MTDNEIIKALERCSTNYNCGDCPYYCNAEDCPDPLMNDALDLINRQKAEIERLKKEVEDKERAYNDEFCLRKEWQSKCRELLKDKQTTKFEAIKEFAERLKEEMRLDDDCKYDCAQCHYDCKDYIPFIDNLVKEMTEGK